MQSARVNEIIVLDNESSDNTEYVVNSYANRGVKYIKTKGFWKNYYKAKEIANKKSMMLFHDVDIVHPKYLKNIIIFIKKHTDLSRF